ncbi:MAG TPA: hypothetical protein VIB99_11735 [Candidatus Limnocylindrales bacterium]|jgi:hypothetical protein
MNAEFQWWLLLVGLAVGAILVFLVVADFSRAADEQADVELSHEADWIAGQLGSAEQPLDPALVEDVLRLNREWLAGPAMQAEELETPAPSAPSAPGAPSAPADPAGP